MEDPGGVPGFWRQPVEAALLLWHMQIKDSVSLSLSLSALSVSLFLSLSVLVSVILPFR